MQSIIADLNARKLKYRSKCTLTRGPRTRSRQNVIHDSGELDRRRNIVVGGNQQPDNISERIEHRGEGIVVDHRNLKPHFIRKSVLWAG